ncbi:hypothetical protein ACWC5I_36845, partial [Kitasatospora sp. NPDC001574]
MASAATSASTTGVIAFSSSGFSPDDRRGRGVRPGSGPDGAGSDPLIDVRRGSGAPAVRV